MSYADVNGLSMYYEVHGDAAVTEDNPALVLAILPDTTHYTVFASPALARTAERFLDA